MTPRQLVRKVLSTDIRSVDDVQEVIEDAEELALEQLTLGLAVGFILGAVAASLIWRFF